MVFLDIILTPHALQCTSQTNILFLLPGNKMEIEFQLNNQNFVPPLALPQNTGGLSGVKKTKRKDYSEACRQYDCR